MDEWVNLIANIGFPIGVAVYLLTRIESKLTDLTQSIIALSATIESMKKE